MWRQVKTFTEKQVFICNDCMDDEISRNLNLREPGAPQNPRWRRCDNLLLRVLACRCDQCGVSLLVRN